MLRNKKGYRISPINKSLLFPSIIIIEIQIPYTYKK